MVYLLPSGSSNPYKSFLTETYKESEVKALKEKESPSQAPKELLLEEVSSTLKALGLSTNAAQTFAALTTHPQATASFLCKETGIPDSKIYYALNELLRRDMVVVQNGNPNVYSALPAIEAVSNLKRQLSDEHSKKLERATSLVTRLELLSEDAKVDGGVELAYIIKGLGRIMNKMKSLIDSAEREIVLLTASERVFEKMSESLAMAGRRGVKLNIAATPNVCKGSRSEHLEVGRLLNCECCLLIVDMRTMITVSNWMSENVHAVMTQDPTLITMSKSYFENPVCCPTINDDPSKPSA